mmetsp:Transcript_72371/g.125476  ORF Transcript_72371/g.125476 Transcript_72371/m.125476 type:complete len:415 (+) Transcript_72371:102-1346(+)
MMSPRWQALLSRAALALLLAASVGSGEQPQPIKMAAARYTLRICNCYAYSLNLEVFQVRTATLIASLSYKECADTRVELEGKEQIDFRLPNILRTMINNGDMRDDVLGAKKAMSEAFNHSDADHSGGLNEKEMGILYRALRPIFNPMEYLFEPAGMSEQELSSEFHRMDENKNGVVSFKEFMDFHTFSSISEVGKDLIGTFMINGELPNPKAFATLLMVGIYRQPQKPVGSYLSANFVDHAFGPKEMEKFGQSAVIAAMNVYRGKETGAKVWLAYDDVPGGTNFSAHHEMIPYGTIVGISEGHYQLDLGTMSAGQAQEIDEHTLYARPQVNYVVIAVGDTNPDAEMGYSYPQELVLFPTPENIIEEAEKDATTEEVVAYDGFAIGLIVVAVLVACGCVGLGYGAFTAGDAKPAT